MTFNELIYNTCFKIVWQFMVAILLLYLMPLMFLSIEFVSIKTYQNNYDISSIFLNVFSWIYICIALIAIVGINICKMLKTIKNEMNIVYHKSMWIEPQCKNNCLILKEFIETSKRIDKMQQRIKEMVDNEKQKKEELIFKVSAASHDLKTPLTIIKGNSDLLLYSNLNKKQKEYLNDIIIACNKMMIYFNLLINYSKTFYDDKSEWKKYSIFEVVETIKQEVFFILEDKSVLQNSIFIERDDMVYINLNYVVRAISNVINNSLEHTNPKNRKIKMDIEYKNCELIFSIWNNGSSFPNDVLENCGKLFYKKDKKISDESVHYGIGLAFVKRVVELHSGKLIIENVDDGAKVIIKLKMI